MSIQIQKYSEEARKHWEKFVHESNNGTIFHTRRFLDYHPTDRFKDHSLVFMEGNKILALFPAIRKERDGLNTLISHQGASYGGFVYRENLSVRSAFDLIEALDVYAKSTQFDAIDMTLPPVIYHARPSHYLDFALYKFGFNYRKREIS